ncbi:MAG: SAM-dependent methyltransferase [Propionibacteriaceae bacterium]|nr:SAM-dependent methyltransferase [Propionibacteriaceae bacterium]
MTRQTTGRNEQGMLADIKTIAESVGGAILGFDIEWQVEAESSTAKRPDIIVRRAEGNREVIASGEAKRPETPKGLHPMVASEVIDAIGKANDPAVASPLAFTTNFLQFALFDPHRDIGASYLNAVVSGSPYTWIDERQASVVDWWKNLSAAGRDALVRPGLEVFFQRVAEFRERVRAVSATRLDEVYLSLLKSLSDALVDDLFAAFSDEADQLRLPQPVLAEAKDRHFDLANAAARRYFVAQAVAEVLTAGLFYQSVRPTFSKLRPLLSGQDPTEAVLLRRALEANLTDATRYTGDYETIFRLSHGAIWALSVESDSLVSLWKSLCEAINGIRLNDIDSEIIGVIFERLISAERRQDMGQHYTQARLARAMVRWAIQRDDDDVVDFCSGGGTFLVEAHNFLKAGGRSHEEILRMVFGNDLDSFAVHLSTVNLATREIYRGRNFPAVSNADAFRLRPGSEAVHVVPETGEPYALVYPSEFNAVVGNPPYDEKAPDPALCRQALGSIHPDKRAPIPTGLPDGINLAAWFILLAAAWLAPNGRIALVLPASILQNEKHEPLLLWLRKHFDLACWHTESDVWFSDARVAPIVLFASPRQASGELGRFVFCEIPGEVVGELIEVDGLPIPGGGSVQVVDLSQNDPRDDALILGTLPDALQQWESADKTIALGDIAGCTVFRGNKLGHAFFRLSDREPGQTGSTRIVEGFGMQPRLPVKYLIPLLKTAKDAPTGEFTPRDSSWWILNAPARKPGQGALAEYIRLGERLGVSQAPSVASRGDDWWHVVWKTTHIAVNAHPQFQHQCWWSDEPFVATDNMQALSFETMSPSDQEILAAGISSAFGSLSTLFRSNEVGCEGVRWLSTRNMTQWHVLRIDALDAEDKAMVAKAYREYRTLRTTKLYEMPGSAREAWLRLTEAVASAADLPDPKGIAELAVRAAIETTRRRRQREIRATGGRTRAGAKGQAKLQRIVSAATVESADFGSLIAKLTNGPRSVRLKTRQIVPVLFDPTGELDRQSEENALVAVLGEGFAASPTFEAGTADQATRLIEATLSRFIERDADGDPPPGYEGMLDSLREVIVKTLQGEVTRRLR